nr:tetratricopeptide repeat protein [Sphingomicrobium lutaoense]
MVGSAVEAGASGVPVDRLLAGIAFAEGKHERALTLARAILVEAPDDAAMLEIAGLAALRDGRDEEAFHLLRRGVMANPNRWQLFNAFGVAADRMGDHRGARAAYRQGLMLAPDEPKLLNNLGWSLLLDGSWHAALAPLERAAALRPDDPLIRRNMELARAANAAELPARRRGESDADFAARLNDAGVIAAAQGEKARAAAAFTRAIEASSQWYGRAARNLDAVRP